MTKKDTEQCAPDPKNIIDKASTGATIGAITGSKGGLYGAAVGTFVGGIAGTLTGLWSDKKDIDNCLAKLPDAPVIKRSEPIPIPQRTPDPVVPSLKPPVLSGYDLHIQKLQREYLQHRADQGYNVQGYTSSVSVGMDTRGNSNCDQGSRSIGFVSAKDYYGK